ncbi:MAG: molybdopterin-dependent oxidoreductase [Vicinamibacteria bacterium]
MSTTHRRACTLCEAICGIVIEHEAGRVVSIRGDADDPLSRGHICPKAVALQDLHEDPDRLRRPLVRRGADFAEASWEEALGLAAQRLAEVQRAHGRNAVAFYQGNPTVHNYGLLLFGQLFSKTLGSRSRFSATSVDQLPHMLASLLMFGHQLLLPVPDVDRARLFVMLGANPLASNGSLMTAPGMARRLKELRARGGRLVVIDPRHTETAALADLHLPIRPGTDALLLMALVRTLFEEGLVRPGRLDAITDGVADLHRVAEPFAPEAVAPATGIDAAAIRALARELGGIGPAVVYGRVGISTQEFGSLACWLVNALNLLTGNLDRVGGSMFARPAADLVAAASRGGERGHFAKGRSRVRGLPEFGGEWPVATLAEEIETAGPGQIRALVTSGGNPVLSTPNGGRLDRALAGLDHFVAIDPYVNETTRHAHVILPPTSALERDHYDLAFHLLAVRNTAKYSPALFEPPAGALHDWQILLALADRLEAARGGGRFWARVARAAFRRLGPAGLTDLLLRFGPYGSGLNPFGHGVSLRRLRREPAGIDLGPLRPCLPARLATPDRRIRLVPEALAADVPRLQGLIGAGARSVTAAADGPLLLIGRRELRSNNSWMHNSERLVKGPDRCTLMMHPEDAAARGLTDGQPVAVSSRVGSVQVPLEITDDVRAGVVCLPHGYGHARPGVRLAVASRHAGASQNDLTDDQRVDLLGGTAAFSGTPVLVAPAV